MHVTHWSRNVAAGISKKAEQPPKTPSHLKPRKHKVAERVEGWWLVGGLARGSLEHGHKARKRLAKAASHGMKRGERLAPESIPVAKFESPDDVFRGLDILQNGMENSIAQGPGLEPFRAAMEHVSNRLKGIVAETEGIVRTLNEGLPNSGELENTPPSVLKKKAEEVKDVTRKGVKSLVKAFRKGRKGLERLHSPAAETIDTMADAVEKTTPALAEKTATEIDQQALESLKDKEWLEGASKEIKAQLEALGISPSTMPLTEAEKEALIEKRLSGLKDPIRRGILRKTLGRSIKSLEEVLGVPIIRDGNGSWQIDVETFWKVLNASGDESTELKQKDLKQSLAYGLFMAKARTEKSKEIYVDESEGNEASLDRVIRKVTALEVYAKANEVFHKGLEHVLIRSDADTSKIQTLGLLEQVVFNRDLRMAISDKIDKAVVWGEAGVLAAAIGGISYGVFNYGIEHHIHAMQAQLEAAKNTIGPLWQQIQALGGDAQTVQNIMSQQAANIASGLAQHSGAFLDALGKIQNLPGKIEHWQTLQQWVPKTAMGLTAILAAEERAVGGIRKAVKRAWNNIFG